MVAVKPLTAEAFAPFGNVLEATGPPDRMINQGLCARFHDRATVDFGPGGRAGVSLFHAEICSLPYRLEMLERHPEGSQAFIPMSEHPWLVIVAEDKGGKPDVPHAFVAESQGINYFRGTWHGVLTPLAGAGLFAVIDRIGTTPNLEEHWLEPPCMVVQQAGAPQSFGNILSTNRESK